jgi:hypothetical protein
MGPARRQRNLAEKCVTSPSLGMSAMPSACRWSRRRPARPRTTSAGAGRRPPESSTRDTYGAWPSSRRASTGRRRRVRHVPPDDDRHERADACKRGCQHERDRSVQTCLVHRNPFGFRIRRSRDVGAGVPLVLTRVSAADARGRTRRALSPRRRRRARPNGERSPRTRRRGRPARA